MSIPDLLGWLALAFGATWVVLGLLAWGFFLHDKHRDWSDE